MALVVSPIMPKSRALLNLNALQWKICTRLICLAQKRLWQTKVEGAMNMFLDWMSTLDMSFMGEIIWCEGVILGNEGKDVSEGAMRWNSGKQVKAYSDQIQKP